MENKNFEWRQKSSIKCTMCNSNYGHHYNIVERGLWWVGDEDKGTPVYNI